MTTEEVISLLLSLGYVDATYHNFETSPYPQLAFNRSLESIVFNKDINGPWLFKFKSGNFEYWSSKGGWKHVEDGLSLESIILLYKDIFKYEVS